MKIKIDVREKDIIKLIQPLQTDLGLTIDFEILTLPLGDFIILNDQGEELLIIERKKLTDLASSIKDGRYEEQSFRLMHSEYHNHNVIYLIEGEIERYKEKYTRIPKKTLYSAMFCLSYFNGFSLMRTANVVETTEYILRITDKLQRDKMKWGYYHDKYEAEHKVYSDVVKREKKANITPKNIGEILLSQIPKVSLLIARAIMAKYDSFIELLEAIILILLFLFKSMSLIMPPASLTMIIPAAISHMFNFF